MYFRDVIGQEEAKRFFIQQVQTGKLHHANLISGKAGYGGLTLGIALARYVQCENRQADDSCGACSSCRKFDKLAHPDTYFIYPTFTSKELSSDRIDSWRKVMAQTNGYFDIKTWLEFNKEKNAKIRAEDCEHIIKNFVLTSFEGKEKIQLIWMAEMLGAESNKLLKIFEEPPANSYFILITEEIELLLPTVISRCQTLKLNGIESSLLKAHLTEKMPDKKAEIDRAVPICHGNYLEAMALILDTQLNLNTAVFKWCKFIVNNAKSKNLENIAALVKFIDGLAGVSREEQKAFFQYFLHFLHETFLLKYTKHCNLADDLMKVAAFFAEKFEIDQIEALQHLTESAVYEIERNGSAKLILMNYAIKSSKVLNRIYFKELN